jgi:hypothetical protein
MVRAVGREVARTMARAVVVEVERAVALARCGGGGGERTRVAGPSAPRCC